MNAIYKEFPLTKKLMDNHNFTEENAGKWYKSNEHFTIVVYPYDNNSLNIYFGSDKYAVDNNGNKSKMNLVSEDKKSLMFLNKILKRASL